MLYVQLGLKLAGLESLEGARLGVCLSQSCLLSAAPPTAISYKLYVTIYYSAVPHKHTLRYNPKAYCTTNAISAHLPQRNTKLEVMHHHIFVIRYLAKQDAFVSHRMGKG